MHPTTRALAVAAALTPMIMGAQDAPPKRTVPAIETRPEVPAQLPLKYSGPPTVGEITPLDLMTRVYKFADDSLMGRLAGTIWNDKGTDYIASELKRLGLQPAGDGGTYFQHPLVRREVSANTSVRVGDRSLEMWKDFAPRDQGPTARPFDGAATIFGGTFGDTASYIPAADAQGKIVVLKVGNGPDGKPDFNVNRALLTFRFGTAAALAVAQLDYVPPGYVDQAYKAANVGLKRDPAAAPAVPSYFYITRAVAEAMLGANLDSVKPGHVGTPIQGTIGFETKSAPGRNVLAILPGSDPKLRGQYVAIGAHNDHVGFSDSPVDHDSVKAVMMHAARQGADSPEPNPTPEQWTRIRATIDSLRARHPARKDSIFNGADDDASGSMSVLEIAERFATAPTRPKRSIIFAFHVGEELGLWGSSYFTDHPTVPRDSIVAQLNLDMVGRGKADDIPGTNKDGSLLHGGPGYVQLIGARRLSSELGDLIEKTNADQQLGLRFDYAMDANGHPQNIYCRSDHYMYARYGIPITFFTSGGHADYHQVTDEPQYIDYDRMSQIAKLVYASAITVGNLDHRPVVDKPRPNPRGACQQ